jgi:hypothetical protein
MAAAYKHAGWAAPLTVAWMAWRALGWRAALRWGGIYLAGLIAAGFALNLVNHGHFTLNILRGLVNGWKFPPQFILDWFAQGPSMYLDSLARWLFAAAMGGWLLARGESPARRALGFYILASTGITLAQMAKLGSDINYLLEPAALAGAAAALAAERWLLAPRTRPLVWLGWFALAVWPLMLNLPANAPAVAQGRRLLAGHFPNESLEKLPGNALLMDSAFLHPDPRAHALMDPGHFRMLTQRGMLDRGPLLERIARREFPYIALSPVAREVFESDPLLKAALHGHYRLTPSPAMLELWEPKP